MLRLLLYSQLGSSYLVPVFWAFGIIVLIGLAVLVFFQRRVSLRLQGELNELEKVRQNNVEYEFVLKAMRLCTWHVDTKTRTLTIDSDFRGGKDNFVVPPGTSIVETFSYLAKSDYRRVVNAMDDICSGRSTSYHQQYRGRTSKTGPFFWEESFATVAARDVDGNPTRIVGTTMRIDDQKEMESALINARNKAAESDRLKTAFIANMGHEIRTPLNAIVGFADLLPVVENEADRLTLISEIQNNNHKLLNIIDGLVSMSKIEAEGKNLVKSQVDINPILKEISDGYAAVVDTSAVIVATKFPYDRMLMTTDVEKLKEVVDHLMQNAVKFTLHGSITLGYDLPDGDHIRIWVKDTGKGIAKEDQERIFDRFVKLDEYIPGTGLGLSVAKSHAESLGGSIGLESELNQGATFWIDLPLL